MADFSILSTRTLGIHHITAKILGYLGIEELKVSRLVNKSFNKEACTILRKRVVVNLLDSDELQRFVNFGFENSFDLPYIKFYLPIVEKVFPGYDELLQLLKAICAPHHSPIYLKSWSPTLQGNGEDFYSTLVQYAESLVKLEVNHYNKMTTHFPMFPDKLQKLPLLKVYREDCRFIDNILRFGYLNVIVKLLESTSSIEELAFGHPTTMQSVFSNQNICFKKLRKLSLTTKSDAGVNDALLLLVNHNCLPQIRSIKLDLWSSMAKTGVDQLLLSASNTLEDLSIQLCLYGIGDGDRDRILVEVPRMEKLKRLKVCGRTDLNLNWLTERNFPMLKKFSIQFPEKNNFSPPRLPLKAILILKLNIREDMLSHMEDIGNFICLFPKVRQVELSVGTIFLRNVPSFEQFMMATVPKFPYSLEEFRINMQGIHETSFDAFWKMLVPGGNKRSMFSVQTFPNLRRVDLMQYFMLYCSRDQGRKPKLRRHQFIPE